VGETREAAVATFVLVHGAWTGGWEWTPTARWLRAGGHEVHMPTLTGCGERSHLATPETDLETHIRDVCALIEYERLEDVALVAHSYGGMVGSGVADRLPERLRALIYVDAARPEDGEAMLDHVSAERRATVIGLAEKEGGGFMVPASLLLETGIEDEAERTAFLARATPHPLPALLQPIRLTGAWQAVPRKAYVLATVNNAHRFRDYHDRAAAEPGWEAAEIPSHHFPMATHPEELATLLIRLAG
jgi:pimeloyl-ACP methyl ester carboxylesterase